MGAELKKASHVRKSSMVDIKEDHVQKYMRVYNHCDMTFFGKGRTVQKK